MQWASQRKIIFGRSSKDKHEKLNIRNRLVRWHMEPLWRIKNTFNPTLYWIAKTKRKLIKALINILIELVKTSPLLRYLLERFIRTKKEEINVSGDLDLLNWVCYVMKPLEGRKEGNGQLIHLITLKDENFIFKYLIMYLRCKQTKSKSNRKRPTEKRSKTHRCQ